MSESLIDGRILKSLGGFYYVESPDGTVLESKPRGIFRKNDFKPVAGDLCSLSVNEEGMGVIESVAPRRNFFLRPPLANLDALYFVVSVKDPAPNYFVLDQLIAVAEYKDIEPVLVVTKTDLEDGSAISSLYRDAGFIVYDVDYSNPESAVAVRRAMDGKLSAICGNSGVGKSTLLNHMEPQLELKTSHISQKLGRGRHTTREVCLYPLENGTYIADTPGFSSVELNRFEVIFSHELPYCFREFIPYLGRCQFRDCTHTVEKGCAVLRALDAGHISASRHDSYRAMAEAAKKINEWETDRGKGKG